MDHETAVIIIMILIGLVIPGVVLLMDDPKIHGK
jgi:hypothetical protein